MGAVSGMTFTVNSGADGDTLTGSNSSAASVNGPMKVSTAWTPPGGGTRSARITTTATATNGNLLLDGPDDTTRYHGGFVKLWGHSGGNVVLAQVQNSSSVVKAQVQRLADGTFRIRNQSQVAVGVVSAYVADDSDVASDGVYWLALQITGSTFRAYLYLPGSSTPLWDSGNQTYGGGTFDRLQLGFVSAVANSDVSFFGWSADDTDPVAQPTTAPTVDAGSDLSIQDAHSASLDSTITGSYTTAAWSVTSGPATSSAQFSSTSADDPTFTPSGGPGSYVLRRTVTYSGGTVFDEVTVAVTALTADFPVVAIVASGWSVQGNATDLLDAVTDNDNASSARSPASPSSSGFRIYLGGGLKPGSGQAWTFPLRLHTAYGSFVATLIRADDTTTVNAKGSVTISTGTAVSGQPDMYDHTVSFSAANWASMPDADWTAGPVLLVEVTG